MAQRGGRDLRGSSGGTALFASPRKKGRIDKNNSRASPTIEAKCLDARPRWWATWQWRNVRTVVRCKTSLYFTQSGQMRENRREIRDDSEYPED
jgi:hypothetical protein